MSRSRPGNRCPVPEGTSALHPRHDTAVQLSTSLSGIRSLPFPLSFYEPSTRVANTVNRYRRKQYCSDRWPYPSHLINAPAAQPSPSSPTRPSFHAKLRASHHTAHNATINAQLAAAQSHQLCHWRRRPRHRLPRRPICAGQVQRSTAAHERGAHCQGEPAATLRAKPGRLHLHGTCHLADGYREDPQRDTRRAGAGGASAAEGGEAGEERGTKRDCEQRAAERGGHNRRRHAEQRAGLGELCACQPDRARRGEYRVWRDQHRRGWREGDDQGEQEEQGTAVE